MHRDDISFQLLSEIEKNLGARLSFAGDSSDQGFKDRAERHRKWKEEMFEKRLCYQCEKHIDDFCEDDIIGLDLDGFMKREYHWSSKQAHLMCSLVVSENKPFSLMCNDCYEKF